MNDETKLFIGIIIATVAIVGGAMFFLSGPGAATKAQKVDEKILIRDDSPKMFSPSATVTLVEFGDYQCPACGAYHTVVKQVLSDFQGSVNFVFRAFPLSIHSNANIASYAALSAGKQGKYWQMHNILYEKQSEWSTGTDARAKIMGYAKDLGLNIEQFTKDIDSSEVKALVDRDVQDGDTLAVNATPTFYVNAEKIENPASLAEFESIIKAAIEKNPKPTAPATSEYHVHANIKVLVDGTPIDFTQAKYQSEEGKELNEFIHFHDGKGDLIHIHKKGMTLKDLFTSLKLDFSGKEVALYVNGKLNPNNDAYEPQDLDKLLIEVGPIASVDTDIKSVADDACIYSLKCPERGKPPTENCVGGLGTGCEK
jgi:protein-disulfide isomerase